MEYLVFEDLPWVEFIGYACMPCIYSHARRALEDVPSVELMCLSLYPCNTRLPGESYRKRLRYRSLLCVRVTSHER